MPDVNEGLRKINRLRADNKGTDWDNVPDSELARAAVDETGDEDIKAWLQAGSLRHLTAAVNTPLQDAGNAIRESINPAGRQGSYGSRLAAELTGGFVEQIPSLGFDAAASFLGGAGRPISLLANAGYDYASALNATGDTNKAALAAGAGAVGHFAAGAGGAKAASMLSGEASTAAKLGAHAVGGAIASLPATAVGAYANQPGTVSEFASEITSDPARLTAMAVQPVFSSAVIGGGKMLKDKATEAVGVRKAATPDLDAEEAKLAKPLDVLAKYQRIPVAERTELDHAQAKKASQDVEDANRRVISARLDRIKAATPQQWDTFPEAPATLKAQMKMLVNKRRQAVVVPKGSEAPTMRIDEQSMYDRYDDPQSGDTWFYDHQKLKEDDIKAAIAGKTTGLLLGYGVPDKPADATHLVVLRDKRGVELAGVVVSPRTEALAKQKLLEQAGPTDTITTEQIQQTLAWRAKNAGLIRHMSLVNTGDEGWFSSHVLEQLNRKFEPEIRGITQRGPAFQLDADGNISSKGLMRTLGKLVPEDVLETIKAHPAMQTILAPNSVGGKVPFESFTRALAEAVPQVEVKRLVPWKVSDEAKAAYINKERKFNASLHLLESSGYEYKYTPVGEEIVVKGQEGQYLLDSRGIQFVDDNGDLHTNPKIPQVINDVYVAWRENAEATDPSLEPLGDAATGRYGVEPIRVEEMTNPVDLLVRVPLAGKDYQPVEVAPGKWRIADKAGYVVDSNTFLSREEALKSRAFSDYNGDPALFRGPHFGDSDVNVVASIRGYEHGDAFFAFEVQSDWGQKLAKDKKFAAEQAAKGRPAYDKNGRPVGSDAHPLAERYQSIGIKSAIIHALQQGKTKLVLPDAETAMMIEGHDSEYNVQSPLRLQEGALDWKAVNDTGDTVFSSSSKAEVMRHIVQAGKSPQEDGMRAAYDRTYQDLARKLTGSAGRRVDLGEFTARGPSDYFGGKRDITGYEYDLTNLSPEVRKLFSLYNAAEQAAADKVYMQRVNDALADPVVERLDKVTMAKRLLAGEQTAVRDAIAKFISGRKTSEDFRAAQAEISKFGVLGVYDRETRTALINSGMSTSLNRRLGTFMHELTHDSLYEWKRENPAAYAKHVELVNDLGFDGRVGTLREMLSGLDSADVALMDLDYLSGKRFDVKDPMFRELVAAEYTSAVAEIGMMHYAKRMEAPSWTKYLPDVVRTPVLRLLGKLKQFLTPGQTLEGVLPKGDFDRMSEIIRGMDKHMTAEQTVSYGHWLKLSNAQVFDPTDYATHLPTIAEDTEQSFKNTRNYSLLKDALKSTGAHKALKAVGETYEKHFFGALFRAVTRPETADAFYTLHHMRPEIQQVFDSHMVDLGQNADGSLTREVAQAKAATWIDKMASGSAEGVALQRKISAVAMENQVRRDAMMHGPEGQVNRSGLVSRQEMLDKYKMSADEALFAEKLLGIPEKVMQQVHATHAEVDAALLAKTLAGVNRMMPSQLLGVTRKLGLFADQFGLQQQELNFWSERLQKEQSRVQPDPDIVQACQAKVDEYSQAKAQFDIAMQQHMVAEVAPVLGLKPNDPRLQHVADAALMQASIRAANRIMTSEPGYAPMVRRGRYLVTVFNQDDMPGMRVKESKGFKTLKEAQDYEASQKAAGFETRMTDRETLEGRAEIYSSPDQMRRLQAKVKEQTSVLIEQFKQQAVAQNDPDFAAGMIDMLTQFEAQFQPLKQELSDVISIKGDRFKERRYLVPGFNEAEFIPNILEYLQYKTVSTRKALTRARFELELERPEIFADNELRERMRREMNYVLTNQAEAKKIREYTFLHYLAFSVRHLVQNAVQIPMNGVSQMVLGGAGFAESYKHFGKAAALSARYAHTGTTGDANLDILLKQGEKEGLTLPKSLEESDLHTDEVQHALDNLQAVNAGHKLIGERLSYQASKGLKAFKKVLMSTSVAAETANRRATFIAGVLRQRQAGVKDLRAQYNAATRFTDQVNFVAGKANRPGFIQDLGAVGAKEPGSPMLHGFAMIATGLQSFTFNHLAQLYAMSKKAYRGDPHAMKAAAVGFGTLAVLGGAVGGLPGAQTAEQVLEEISGGDIKLSLETRERIQQALTLAGKDDDWKLAGDRIADGVLYGLPALAGVYASDSIGLGSPFVRYRAGSQMKLLEVLGPSAGMVNSYGQAFGLFAREGINDGSLGEAFRTAAPSFLKNAVRGFDVINKGTALDRLGKPVTDTLEATGQLSSALGFTPMEVEKQRTADAARAKATKKLDDARTQNAHRIAQLLQDFQLTGNADYLHKAQALNNEHLAETAGEDPQSFNSAVSAQLMKLGQPSPTQPTMRTEAEFNRIASAFPSTVTQPIPRVSSLLGELSTAQLLEQAAVTQQLLESLPQRVRSAVLADALDQAGLSLGEQALVKSPRSMAARLQGMSIGQ